MTAPADLLGPDEAHAPLVQPPGSQASSPDWSARMRAVAAIAGEHADDVDRNGRFPHETVAALRQAGLLGVMIRPEHGGPGLPVRRIAALCAILAARCGASGLIYAMHQIKLACAVNHPGRSAWYNTLLRRMVDDPLLIASVTSEVGVGGDIRRSIAGLRRESDRLALTKRGSTISYGAQADALMVTLRATEDAPPNHQVMVTVLQGDYRLERTGRWDSLGMRGTCSDAFIVEATATPAQLFETPFADILAATMLPVSHILWSSVWFGIASDAVARTRAQLRAEMRRREQPGPVAPGLSELVGQMLMLKSRLLGAIDSYAVASRNGAEPLPMPLMTDLSLLKTSMSEGCLKVVQQALNVSGFAAYRNDAPSSLGRHLRDLHSAPLMINNSRHVEQMASSLLVGQLPFELG